MGSDRDWTQKSPTQLFMAAFPVINLQTGKLYGTFTAEQWAPGEMTIEVVDDPAEFANYGKTEMITDPLNGPGAERVEPGSLWVFRLYGATPGSIVFTDVQARLAE
jgi:hypothetical protein